jgi:hypothetical protein
VNEWEVGRRERISFGGLFSESYLVFPVKTLFKVKVDVMGQVTSMLAIASHTANSHALMFGGETVISNKESEMEVSSDVAKFVCTFDSRETIQSARIIAGLTSEKQYREVVYIVTDSGNHYVAQTYPQKLEQAESPIDALNRTCFCQEDVMFLRHYYAPSQKVRLAVVADLIEEMENIYNPLTNNCKVFCDSIMSKIKGQ